MPFPETPRVIYQKNPLREVICQLRFPPILRIEERPADFQDRVRDQFPDFTQSVEPVSPAPPPAGIRPDKVSNYQFSSEDGTWKTNLTRTFLSLSTNAYERWEVFREKLDIPLQALIDVYKPHRFTRIGLRYVDVIRRSLLGLDKHPWSELLNTCLLGVAGDPSLKEFIEAYQASYILALKSGEDRVQVVTGLRQDPQSDETYFEIDSDFFTSQPTSLEGATEKLTYFNTRASRLIRWCITEPLHSAMEPSEL
jgi:uncharacterized protein (TIGR04255 family)